jgi:hypothetical protein
VVANCYCCVVKTPNLHSGGSEFESQSGDWVSWLSIFFNHLHMRSLEITVEWLACLLCILKVILSSHAIAECHC